jgi:ribokinase
VKKIVVVGSLNMDLVAFVGRMPAEGETIAGNNFSTFPGGKGANQVVAAARLGGNVAIVGRVGRDSFAEDLLRSLRVDSVDVTNIVETDQPTGTALILVTEAGVNSIVVIPGSNATLMPHDLNAYEDLFRDAAMILAQLEIPLETVVHLGDIASRLGVPFILDPAPAHALPGELLKNVTWLTPNETEARTLLQSLDVSEYAAVGEDEALAYTSQRLLQTGVRNVVLKLGARGVYLAGADVQAQRVPPFAVNAIDSTAAGDAFNGGFAYALATGMSPAEAARFGCAVAAVSVTRTGAQPSMPTLAQVDLLLSTRETQH